jgi:hypothetical protein
LAVDVVYDIKFVGETVLVEIPQDRLLPTDLGLMNEEMVKEIDWAAVPEGFDAVKLKVELLMGDKEEVLQLVQLDPLLMNLVSDGTSI